MKRLKILYVLRAYPQISETYIKVESELLSQHHDIQVISLDHPQAQFERPLPYRILSEYEDILAFAREFQPDVIHTHWLSQQVRIVSRLSKDLQTPFTVRSHSFDTLWKDRPWYKKPFGSRAPRKVCELVDIVNEPQCLAVLGFPYAIPLLEKAGVKKEKLIAAGPVFDFERFHDESENGADVINVGACLPKKRFEDFIHLATLVPELKFNLYTTASSLTEHIKDVNRQAGGPVEICDPVQHREMPAVLKAHRWIVYTADPLAAAVGWPLVLVEAQAAGVGVCMRRLRPDLEDYLGGAAVLYDSVEELVDILKDPVPESVRQAGFVNAKRYEIRDHLHLLTDCWSTL